ncbi:hypothetical protein WJX84_008982 [Apatococcus fuscideae]|uniref:Methyltransferase domain-containing protein n=1 Tax=Apatococcus fuscideae TaxID=2026836 RepID=A0AAW1SUA2_9CHLO
MDTDEGEASELGTLEHWESVYATELANLQSTGDEGEVWFGIETMQTMLSWTLSLLEARHGSGVHALRLLDIGTGNGAMLVALYKKGFHNITGTDYSRASLVLAAAVLAKNGCTCALLKEDDMTNSKLLAAYDVLLDKGAAVL